ncbi:type II secretion system protein [Methanocorpusculum labreanum Z]|uniref:Type II secretion system protein n=1 Tax=Methanocorpusculum labreanum (strain ATCC 43576 / DSM 4855 / Z) TaxID=410358 RepID=A2STP6_METLZ|nr:type II secretion system F family protein [Methanocorpusculum labreanum]ABN07702.1 type II secretion system protein [Methanocorpusculum labreanum Z]
MRQNPDILDKILFNTKLENALRSAHITVPVDQYMMLTILVTVFTGIMTALIGVLITVMGITIPVISFLPVWILIIISCILIPIGVFICFYYYPVLEAQGRKNKIEQDLPFAITYMQALSSTITLYEIFRSVYEAADLYGEVSRECGLIVRDVELFGEDLLTAIENTIKITPSENFRELLNDLALVYRSGGNMRNFFNSKSESYREIARQQLDALLQFLEMIAEVYVTAFVAGPIAIMIMLVAQNLSGQNTMGNIMPIMMVFLPLGAVILIVILYILLPPDNLGIASREIRDSEYGPDLLESGTNTEPDAEFIKQINARKNIIKYLNILRHPIKFFISDYTIPGIIGVLLASLVGVSWITGTFAKIFPSMTMEVLVCIIIIAASLPLMMAYEIRRRYVTKVEKQLPEFLREIADMRDIGMTLQGAISMISGNKTGVLSSEIKIVTKELSYGAHLSNALVRMEERIGLVSVKRAISLLVKASEVTDYVREILTIAISDLEHYVKMKSKRLNVSFVYLAVIYLSFGIYLYSAYQMNVAFISSFTSFDITFDLTSNKTDMFNIGIILAFFSGIMAGQMSSNSVLCGLKHSIIMLIATIITFVYII